MSRYADVHKWATLGGPGDSRPTALQVVKDYEKEGALEGQVILITGVSSGIGASTAIALASTGATIFCAGRSVDKAKQSLKPIVNSPKVHFLSLDLSSLANVRSFAEEFLAQSGGKLNILINNAGGISADYKTTVDGVEHQFALNYLSPFYLFGLLRDALISSATPDRPSRVVNVASYGHRFGPVKFDNLSLKGEYDPALAYAQAKTSSIYMASEIERRFGSQNLHAWSLHPGAIKESNFMSNSGWDQTTLDNIVETFPANYFKSSDQGAATTVWAALSDDVLADGARGKYLEDCSVSKPTGETEYPDIQGYVKHTYDEESARRLWEVSEGIVGIKV